MPEPTASSDRRFTDLKSAYANKPVISAPPGFGQDDRSRRARYEANRINNLAGLRNEHVLEIGCGEGDLAFEIAHNYNSTVVGVDIRSFTGWQALSHPRLTLVQHDLTAEESLWPANTFSRIISRAVWEHIRHPYAALKRCRDLLKPGGRMYLYANQYRSAVASHLYREIPFPWPHLLFSPAELAARLGRQEIGEAFWVNKLTYAHYLLYFKKLGFYIVSEILDTRPIDRAFFNEHERQLGLYPEFDLELDFFEVVLEFDPDHPKEPIPDPVYRLKR